jgi:hypothetical protein
MNKLQKILIAASPIIAQPPPLTPVLQAAAQAGIVHYLHDAGDSEPAKGLVLLVALRGL